MQQAPQTTLYARSGKSEKGEQQLCLSKWRVVILFTLHHHIHNRLDQHFLSHSCNKMFTWLTQQGYAGVDTSSLAVYDRCQDSRSGLEDLWCS